MANYYLDGTTLNNATAIYQDSALTQCAPSGFYSDGVSVREQVTNGNSCSLNAPQVCPTCATPCGGTINGNGAQGVYNIDLDLGGTASDTGAVKVLFDPVAVPDGIQVTYDGVIYNKLSSPQFGLLQSSVPGVPTYIGAVGSDSCGVAGGSYSDTINVFQYQQGNFVNTGTTQSVTIASGQAQLTAGQPGDCIMFIPKPNPTPAVGNFQFIGPCSGTAFNLQVSCPTPLPEFGGSISPQSVSQDACDQGNIAAVSILRDYYHGQVSTSSVAGFPQLHDYVFLDHDSVSFPADGWYLHSTGYTYQLVSGVVTSVVDSCKTVRVSDCVTGTQYIYNERFGTQLQPGEVVEFYIINSAGTGTTGSKRCGTITSLTQGETTTALQNSVVTRACDDTTHCPTE